MNLRVFPKEISMNTSIEQPVKTPTARRAKGVEFVKDGDAVSAYLAEIKHSKTLTLAEEQALAQRIQKGDKQALNALVEANLKFVVSVCRNYQHQGLPMGDLINEGNLGLMRAAQRFDGSMNFKFISYAVWWIRQGILSALAEQSRVLNISAGRVGIIHKISKANHKLEQKLGRAPSQQELADEMGMTEKEITESLQLATSPLSLTTQYQGEAEGSLEECLKDENAPEADKSAMQFLLSENLNELLGSLEDKEQMVLRLYFGVGGKTAYSLEEIAQRMNVTRERVRQIKEKALQRLRHPSRLKKLTAFQG
jgi:RNA polymerase primary sigma factor